MDHADVLADVLIVGAGHAGAAAAAALRARKFAGSILMIGDEPHLPYERPPLSKEYFAGEKDFARLLLRPATFWAERDVRILTGCRVTALDPAAHQVITDSGARIGYGRLIWATGGAPRRLTCPGADLPGVFAVRTRDDADAILAALPAARRAVIVGGGYIGLEAASALRRAGCAVTLIEAQDRLLARVAGPIISGFYAGQHRDHGVDLRLNQGVAAIEGAGRVQAVLLADGSRIAADMVIVGIGIIPAVAPLLEAGAAGGNGVAVDARTRTSLPGIFAIGDCAAHQNRFAGGARIRLESVQNANDMAATAAREITGAGMDYEALPWFWSNQYDLRLQTVGLSAGFDAEILRGDPASGGFSVVYLRQGRVIALDCVNMASDFAQGRALVMTGATPDPDRLADQGVALGRLRPPD